MKAGTISDEVLVKRFNEGDARAMQAIYDMYFTHLFYFAYRIIQNRAEAEDIAVVTLEIFLRRHPDFLTMPNIKAFLFITVRNKCLKFIDAEKRHRRSETELGTLQDEKDDYVLAQMVHIAAMDGNILVPVLSETGSLMAYLLHAEPTGIAQGSHFCKAIPRYFSGKSQAIARQYHCYKDAFGCTRSLCNRDAQLSAS